MNDILSKYHTLSFSDKAALFKELSNDLNIILFACYGTQGNIDSLSIDVLNKTINIYTDICTG